LRTFIDRLREMVSSNGNDRLLSVKELKDANVIGVDGNGNVVSVAAETVVFSTPPPPTGVAASPAIRNVIVTWDLPEYPNHAYAEVWGASTNDIGAAVLLGQTPGAVYTDALGPSATRYYWVRFVNTQFTTGAYNSTFGTSATTGPDLAYTMDLLAAAYGDTSEAPFFQLNSPLVIGGVTIPAGTYMKAGFIYDGVITNAKIANAAIDNAKIASLSADKLTAGTIAADRLTSTVINAKVTNIDTAVIQSGFINAARINSASIANAEIAAAKITTGTIDSARIGDLDASKITTGTMSADRIDAATLSAITADLGTITAGTMTFSVDANNYLKIDGPNQRIDVYSGGVLRVRLGKL
jgi:hypothetical protein